VCVTNTSTCICGKVCVNKHVHPAYVAKCDSPNTPTLPLPLPVPLLLAQAFIELWRLRGLRQLCIGGNALDLVLAQLTELTNLTSLQRFGRIVLDVDDWIEDMAGSLKRIKFTGSQVGQSVTADCGASRYQPVSSQVQATKQVVGLCVQVCKARAEPCPAHQQMASLLSML
jgi:hypothetical protein